MTSEEAIAMAFHFGRALTTKSDTLDKIRDEIDLETRAQVELYTNTDAVIDAVLDVIDKYKSEMEVEECR